MSIIYQIDINFRNMSKKLFYEKIFHKSLEAIENHKNIGANTTIYKIIFNLTSSFFPQRIINKSISTSIEF